MKMRRWFSQRGPAFIVKRGGALLRRYGIKSDRAEARVEATMALLAKYGCAPTFPTPGRVVRSHSKFIRRLQDAGAEIAVHSYDHVDLKGYLLEEACDQLLRGARAFERVGIENHGFRCPYLSCTPALIEALPDGLFGYSSNDAVSWEVAAPEVGEGGLVWKTIRKFYAPESSSTTLAVPHMRRGIVEIPVSVPDDLQLYDGLKVGSDGLARAWIDLLDQTYRRGELFTLIFHPELAERCLQGFDALLDEALRRQPGVWLARLRDIHQWWCEKQGFQVHVRATADGWHLSFIATERATILARDLTGINLPGSATAWFGRYGRLHEPVLHIAGPQLPLIGLAAGVPEHISSLLQEQGYIIRRDHLAGQCAIYLSAGDLAGLPSDVALIDYVENCPGPLVRFWRWPAGARSALAITGDLDALTLGDYASRLWAR